MTKKQFLKQIEQFPDDAVIKVEIQESAAPVGISNIDEGAEILKGKKRELIIICPKNPEWD